MTTKLERTPALEWVASSLRIATHVARRSEDVKTQDDLARSAWAALTYACGQPSPAPASLISIPSPPAQQLEDVATVVDWATERVLMAQAPVTPDKVSLVPLLCVAFLAHQLLERDECAALFGRLPGPLVWRPVHGRWRLLRGEAACKQYN